MADTYTSVLFLFQSFYIFTKTAIIIPPTITKWTSCHIQHAVFLSLYSVADCHVKSLSTWNRCVFVLEYMCLSICVFLSLYSVADCHVKSPSTWNRCMLEYMCLSVCVFLSLFSVADCHIKSPSTWNRCMLEYIRLSICVLLSLYSVAVMSKLRIGVCVGIYVSVDLCVPILVFGCWLPRQITVNLE